MIDFLWHGMTCAFWCLVWHKVYHGKPSPPTPPPPAPPEDHSSLFRQARQGGKSL